MLLKTNIYKELLLKYNVGTQYPVIKDDDVLGLIIPIINNDNFVRKGEFLFLAKKMK